MLARLASLRVKLLLAMLVAGCAGLAASYALVSHLERSDEATADRAKALRAARAVARDVEAGGTVKALASMQRVLPDERIVVSRSDRVVFAGPANPRPLELTVTVPFRGGRVVLYDHKSTAPSGVISATDLLLVAAALVALVIGAALVVETFLVRTLRVPIERATDAARRVAAGDLTARIGPLREDEFAELGSTFDHLAERLEVADRDQRRFLADVAHEIATPVNAIRGFAAALADGTMASEGERAEAVELIENQGRRIDALLGDLRELTRLDLTETLHEETIELDELCATLVARFRLDAAAAGVDLRLEGVARRDVRSDRRLVETVLDNLVSNAIRYTPSGGRVRISAGWARGEAVVAVRDTGIGIAAEHRKRIFERLYRVDEARDRVSGGSGLGLALAQRAARAVGGRLEVDSEPGRGSEFRLVLPDRGAS